MADEQLRSQLLQALRLWTAGEQAGAVEHLRSAADAGEPAALGLVAWFLHQMGDRWREGVPYAQEAVAKGMPWVANYYFGNMLGDPNMRGKVVELMGPALRLGVPIDPIAHALQPYQQGDHNTAAGLLGLASGPNPWQAAGKIL